MATLDRLFIICGPESAGNRLCGEILKHGGARGEASTRQPTFPHLRIGRDEFWIKHHPEADDIMLIRKRGFRPIMIICIREPEANAKSMVARGHVSSRGDAWEQINRVLFHNIVLAHTMEVDFEVIPYESWSEKAIAAFQRRWGLTVRLGELEMFGQSAPSHYVCQNDKHYEA